MSIVCLGMMNWYYPTSQCKKKMSLHTNSHNLDDYTYTTEKSDTTLFGKIFMFIIWRLHLSIFENYFSKMKSDIAAESFQIIVIFFRVKLLISSIISVIIDLAFCTFFKSSEKYFYLHVLPVNNYVYSLNGKLVRFNRTGND